MVKHGTVIKTSNWMIFQNINGQGFQLTQNPVYSKITHCITRFSGLEPENQKQVDLCGNWERELSDSGKQEQRSAANSFEHGHFIHSDPHRNGYRHHSNPHKPGNSAKSWASAGSRFEPASRCAFSNWGLYPVAAEPHTVHIAGGIWGRQSFRIKATASRCMDWIPWLKAWDAINSI